MSTSGGVMRDHGTSRPQKFVFAALHGAIVAICLWLVSGAFDWADLPRARLLMVCALLYWLRHCATLFVLLKRKVAYSEALGLCAFIAFFDIGFLLLGAGVLGGEAVPFRMIDAAALGLVAVGSYLNTASEWQRMRWKRRPESKGHCYTEGLFAYAMHINYFGDAVLFTGWAILTASLYAWVIPVFITASFVFFHIPALDLYLAKRYGAEFKTYARKTAKFVPFVY